MATASDVREWARAGGQTVSDRGRIPEWLAQAWNDGHPADLFTDLKTAPGNGAAASDYPEGMTDQDFTAEATIPEDTGEARPRTVRKRGNTPAGTGGWRARFGGKAKGKKARKPRVGVDDLICSTWRLMARIARPMPPLQRVLRVQAPVAGLLLEDAIKDTLIDTFLQPLARLQAGGKTVVALAGPPMIVTMVCLHVAQAQAAGRPPSRLFMETAREMLRESLLIWMDVAGPKFEQAMRREREFEEKYGATVDETMEWIFSPTMPPDATEEAQAAAQAAEDEAVRRAQGLLGDAA